MITAKDKADYLNKKITPGIGINTEGALGSAVIQVENVNFPAAEEVQKRSIEAFEQTYSSILFASSRAPQDFRLEDSPTLQAYKENQRLWVCTAGLAIVSAMGYRAGSLEAVPFLEPKSISDDPAIYYPFAA